MEANDEIWGWGKAEDMNYPCYFSVKVGMTYSK